MKTYYVNLIFPFNNKKPLNLQEKALIKKQTFELYKNKNHEKISLFQAVSFFRIVTVTFTIIWSGTFYAWFKCDTPIPKCGFPT